MVKIIIINGSGVGLGQRSGEFLDIDSYLFGDGLLQHVCVDRYFQLAIDIALDLQKLLLFLLAQGVARFALFLLGYQSESSQVDPSSTVIRYFLPFPLH